MRDAPGSNPRVGGQMQLTILSAEILKSQLGAKLDISISCNISEPANNETRCGVSNSEDDAC